MDQLISPPDRHTMHTRTTSTHQCTVHAPSIIYRPTFGSHLNDTKTFFQQYFHNWANAIQAESWTAKRCNGVGDAWPVVISIEVVAHAARTWRLHYSVSRPFSFNDLPVGISVMKRRRRDGSLCLYFRVNFALDIIFMFQRKLMACVLRLFGYWNANQYCILQRTHKA